MANYKAAATLFLCLVFFAPLASACESCQPKYPPKQPPPNPFCPRDTLKLGVCWDVLAGLVKIVVGTPPSTECCMLLKGLDDIDAAACLCTVIKANVLGTNLRVPVALTLLVNSCGKKIPPGFKCV